MIPEHWRPHCRGADFSQEGELVGYLVPAARPDSTHTVPAQSVPEDAGVGDHGLVLPVNLLGVALADAVDVASAESTLDAEGLASLAGRWELCLPGAEPVRVTVAEVDRDHVVMVEAGAGIVGAPPPRRHELNVPVSPDVVRPAG